MKNSKTNSKVKQILENNNLFQILTNNTKKSNRKGILTMKLRNIAAIAALTLTMVITGSTYAQDDINKTLAEMDAKSFQPLTNAFSSGINSGLYHNARIDKKFSMYIGVKGSTTPVVEAPSNLKVTSVPFAVPQVSVGLYGTEVTFRYTPSIGLGKLGSVNTMGFALRHCVTQYFKKSPLDVSVQLALQSLNVYDSKENNVIHSSSFAAAIQFSKQLSVFTMYAGVQYEKTGVDFNFNYGGYSSKFHTENQNKIRGTVGLNIKLGPFNINGDYNIGKNNSISTGFGFAF